MWAAADVDACLSHFLLKKSNNKNNSGKIPRKEDTFREFTQKVVSIICWLSFNGLNRLIIILMLRLRIEEFKYAKNVPK